MSGDTTGRKRDLWIAGPLVALLTYEGAHYGAAILGPYRKAFLKRDVPDSTSFWNSNAVTLTS